MPKFTYECPECGTKRTVIRLYSDMERPELCAHLHLMKPQRPSNCCRMTRLFTASFQIIAHREQDKRENKLYDILTKGGTEADKLALYKQDMARLEATMNAMPDVPKEFGTEDILNTGICEAARSGDVGIANWRKEHIPEKTYKEGEAITA